MNSVLLKVTLVRVALAHHWFIQPRGGERVLAQFGRMFPDAPILTAFREDQLAGWPEEIAALGPRVKASRLQLPYRLVRDRPGLMPGLLVGMPVVLPRAFRRELATIDLLLISDAGVMKLLAPPDGVKTCVYLHSPMRHIWHEAERYEQQTPRSLRPLQRRLAGWVRSRDRAAAKRVTAWAVNSATTARRAAAAYGIDAEKMRVIHPPVSVPAPSPRPEHREGLLVVSGMEPYKRDDLAVLAATRLGIPLTVVGNGPCRAALQSVAGPNVRFLGFLDDCQRDRLYRSAAGFVFCADEDFGLTPVEAMARGCPVVAYGSGGATETVAENAGGLFFPEQSVDSAMDGIQRLLARPWDEDAVRRSVARFSPERFEAEVREWLNEV
jgi:glycosyltransferase involved in cell wall biosynthesis